MSFLSRRAAEIEEQAAPPRASSFLARRAEMAEAAEAAKPTTSRGGVARNKNGDILRGTDPENGKFDGRTTRFAFGNGQPWFEEDPNWTDESVELETDRIRHTGRRLAIRVCPECREVRGNGGRAECYCGSDAPAVRLDGKIAKDQAVRTRKQTPVEKRTAADRIAAMRAAMRAS
jgi:hypothetical protein